MRGWFQDDLIALYLLCTLFLLITQAPLQIIRALDPRGWGSLPYGTEWICYDFDLLSGGKISAINNKIGEETDTYSRNRKSLLALTV